MVLSACLYIFVENSKLQRASMIVGLCSTGFSVILSLVATIYSYVSGEKTNETLEKIEKENKTLVDFINNRRIQDGMGAKGLERFVDNKNLNK